MRVISVLLFVDRIGELVYANVMSKEQAKPAEELSSGGMWSVLKGRGFASVAVIALIVAAGWYQSAGTEAPVLSSLKSNILSFIGSGTEEVAAPVEGELSTAGDGSMLVASSGGVWSIRKAEKGSSVWQVYSEMIAGNAAVGLKNQTTNGLKNLTLLKNGVSQAQIANASLVEGMDYSFLSSGAVDKYATLLAEANSQMVSGTALSDLDSTHQLAYRVANAPSYQFLYSLPVDDLKVLYE